MEIAIEPLITPQPVGAGRFSYYDKVSDQLRMIYRNMKKLLALVIIVSISAECLAQKATVLLNNFDSDNAVLYTLYHFGPPGLLAPSNMSVELFGGPSAAQMQPVTIAGSTTSIIPMSTVPGFFDGGVGVVPGVTPGATATFQLWGFVGPVPPPGQIGISQSATWTQATGIWDDKATPPQPPTGPPLQVPAGFTIFVPEPSATIL